MFATYDKFMNEINVQYSLSKNPYLEGKSAKSKCNLVWPKNVDCSKNGTYYCR